MKPVFSKTTDKILLIAKLSDDRMKLFLDVDPVTEPEAQTASAQTNASTNTEDQKTANNGSDTAASPAEGSQSAPMAETAKEAEAPPHKVIILRAVSRDDILHALSEFIKPDRLNLAVIDDIAACLTRGESIKERRVAKGEEPQTGADGKLLFLVKRFTGQGEVTIDEKGHADFRALKMFDNVTPGTVVARIYPPKNGIDGHDALGKALPSKAGKPVKITVDKTLSIKNPEKAEEPYQVIAAETEGFVADDQGKLTIKTELNVSGDLDYHLGAIDFIGSVNVKGNVNPGFSIKAKKGITIAGDVREANLICSQGSIHVKGHVFGGSSSKVVTGLNFHCSVAQELDAEVVGNITVEKEALDCNLRAQGTIMMDNATLAGGRALTVCGAQVKLFGSDKGRKTAIVLCSDVEMTAEYMQIVRSIESHEKAMKLIELHLGPFSQNPARIDVLKGDYRDKMKKLYEKKTSN